MEQIGMVAEVPDDTYSSDECGSSAPDAVTRTGSFSYEWSNDASDDSESETFIRDRRS